VPETSFTAERVAEIAGGTLEGDGSIELRGLASIDESASDLVTFAGDERNLAKIRNVSAGAIIVPKEAQVETDIALIKVENVQLAVARLLEAMDAGEDLPEEGIHTSAYIAQDAKIGDRAAIGPHVTVETGVTIGDGSVLCHGVYVGRATMIGENSVLAHGTVIRRNCRIGSRVRIGPNSVIGHDGFGYVTSEGIHHKVPHVGNVVIEDDVELGACCCVDRAKWGSTLIKAGAKIDNLSQIAHNVEIGSGALLAALAGVAGSAKLGDYVMLGGHVGIRDNIEIGNGTMIAACSCLASNAGTRETLFGIPAKDIRQKRKELAAMGKLPDLVKRVKQLEKKLADARDDSESSRGGSQ